MSEDAQIAFRERTDVLSEPTTFGAADVSRAFLQQQGPDVGDFSSDVAPIKHVALDLATEKLYRRVCAMQDNCRAENGARKLNRGALPASPRWLGLSVMYCLTQLSRSCKGEYTMAVCHAGQRSVGFSRASTLRSCLLALLP